ncbi:hypothetical protein FSY45_19485 [Comamonas sp. Z1]|uniref:hypothetical protein n=1 Tax=Comamonas sp. Z1 TaxID=2601246 RepID=UPI0011E62FE2|nr:hypothetical protein [Comamonas sp. Z1]TYK74346.1 hypothetical protein FSY45_19485 [Comamonas sp. Z1]
MLTVRKSMKRTGFKPRGLALVTPEDIEARHEARQQRLAALMLVEVRETAPLNISTEVVAVPKEDAIEYEPYRRLVAKLPCMFCGIEGYSQHAHENENKGKGLKLDDRRAMALCCTRPGIEGCHVAFDQYRLLPGGRDAHVEQGKLWSAQTRQQLRREGRWPAKLPHMPGEEELAFDG